MSFFYSYLYCAVALTKREHVPLQSGATLLCYLIGGKHVHGHIGRHFHHHLSIPQSISNVMQHVASRYPLHGGVKVSLRPNRHTELPQAHPLPLQHTSHMF